jgi:hypothetical protein
MKGLAWRRLTLGEALRHSMKFRFTCAQCGRTVVKSPISLAVLYDLSFEARLHEIGKKLVCGECGCREVQITNEPDP